MLVFKHIVMDKTLIIILIVSFIVSKVKCWSNLELLEKQRPGVKPFEGHKVVRAFPKTRADNDYLNSLEENPDIEVDFWSRSRYIDIHVTPEDYEKLGAYLAQWNIDYRVINNNLQKSLEEEQKGHYRGQVHGWHGQYHNFEEIIQKINNLNNNSPLAQVVDIGRSYENREIKGIEITDGKVESVNKQKIVTMCGQHAREWISPATCMYIIENMIQNYGKEANVTQMLNRFNWVFIPVMNPDGYAYTWDKNGDRLWRKNRQPNGKSPCHGTDLNRNWGYKFAGSGSSDTPCSDIYRGAKAFSAPEVKGVADYIMRNRNKVYCFLDIHSYSQLLMYPWSYSKAVIAKDKDELHRVSEAAVNALRSVHNTDFKSGAAAVIIYEAAGSGKDWVYGSMGVKYAFVFELRDTGDKGFVLPQDQIIPTGEETLAAFHSLAITMKDYENKRTNF